MEEQLKQKYSKKVVSSLLQRFGLNIAQVELVGSHQSFVYKAKRQNENVYFRVTLSTHRGKSQLEAEIVMNVYHNNNGFNVASLKPSINGAYIESYIEDGVEFHAVLFEEAEGLGVGKYPWSLDVPKRVGVMTARLHNLMNSYEPTGSKRPEWWENTFLVDARNYLPDNHDGVIDAIEDLVSRIKELPKDKNHYGLTHGDMVACNYNMTDDKITLFDFDEACYCWFVNDIAISLFYDALGWKGVVNVPDAIESFKSFISGYRTVREIDSYWISKIGLFLKLREAILYVAICRSRDLNNLDYWTKNFMDGRKERIENNIPFVELDFQKVIKS